MPHCPARRLPAAWSPRGCVESVLLAPAPVTHTSTIEACSGVETRTSLERNSTLKAAFEESDTLLLIPSFAPVEARIQQHANALAAAREAGVQRVVVASFAAASPESKFLVAPFMLYAESKLRLSGLDWTIVRNGMYLDPIADWVPDLVKQRRLPYPVEKGAVAYICRDDLAGTLAAVCCQDGHNGKLFELTGPEALSMSELADTISRVTGEPVRYEQVSEEEFALECRKAGEPEPLISVILGCSAGPILTFDPGHVFDEEVPRFGIENAFLGRSDPGAEWVEIPGSDQRSRHVPLQVGLYNPEKDVYARHRGEIVAADFFVASYFDYVRAPALTKWTELGDGKYNERNGMWELLWDASSLPADKRMFMVRADLTDSKLRTRTTFNLAVLSPKTVLVEKGEAATERAAFEAYQELHARLAKTEPKTELQERENDSKRTGGKTETQPLRLLRGDCNADGLTDGVVDAVLLLNFNFLGREAPVCRAACDVNTDGEITGVADAIYLLKHNFLGGPAPAAPYPSCGVADGQSDAALGCDAPAISCD